MCHLKKRKKTPPPSSDNGGMSEGLGYAGGDNSPLRGR